MLISARPHKIIPRQDLCSVHREYILSKYLFIFFLNEGGPSIAYCFKGIVSSPLTTTFNSKIKMRVEYKMGSFKTRITKAYVHTKHKGNKTKSKNRNRQILVTFAVL